jgi:predicted PurR-regulated permease PerM
MLGLTLAALGIIAKSARVIGWLLAAAAIAGLLHPVVERLGKRMPRALALAIVVLFTLGVCAAVGYAVVDDVVRQLHQLQRAVPSAARDLERSSSRIGEAAREINLADRAKSFVNELPARLRGGDVQSALRSAATRGVAFLATTVLTIFFLIHGPRLLRGALNQLPEDRQADAKRIGLSVYRRTWNYVAGSLAMAVVAGFLAYVCADLLNLPGKAPLALWMTMLDPIPMVGVVLGSLPLILLAATTATWQASVLVTAVLVGWQVFEALSLQPRVEDRSLHIGPFVTVSVVMVGLVMYGIGGAIVSLIVIIVAAATLDEVVAHGPHSSAPVVTSSE